MSESLTRGAMIELCRDQWACPCRNTTDGDSEPCRDEPEGNLIMCRLFRIVLAF